MKELFPHGSAFPYRLVDPSEKSKVCWFSCEEHLHKHLLRYSIKDAKIDVMDGYSYTPVKIKKTVKRKTKRKPKQTFSTVEDFFQ